MKKRIESTKTIKNVCNSMKNIAVARMPAAIKNTHIARNFCESFQPIWKNPVTEKPCQKYLFLLTTSNFGLCGSSTSRITRKAQSYIDAHKLNPDQYKMLFLGARGSLFFEQVRTKGAFDSVVRSIHECDYFSIDSAARIAEECVFPKDFDKLVIVYNYFVNRSSFSTHIHSIPSKKIALANKKQLDHYENDYMDYQMDTHLSNLYEMSVLSSIYYAVLESAAVEQCTRFLTMQNATKNIDEMITEMQIKYDAMRQDQITTEICEVNAGRMAVMLTAEEEE